MKKKLPVLAFGIEEELFLVDATSLDLTPCVPKRIFEQFGKRFSRQISPEFYSCQAELVTTPHQDFRRFSQEYAALRLNLVELASHEHLAVLASSTHPFALWQKQIPRTLPRYRYLREQLHFAADRLLVAGMHVHVGIENLSLRFALMQRMQAYLPLFICLSTSSAFWQGIDTGFASYRLNILENLPRSGLPPYFKSFEELDIYVQSMIKAGFIRDASELWWDLRLSCRYPTLEMRILDTVTCIVDSLAIIAFYVCLVQALYEALIAETHTHARGKFSSQAHKKLGESVTLLATRENRWRAQRFSIHQCMLLDLFSKDHYLSARPVKTIILELLPYLKSYAAQYHCETFLELIPRICQEGTSSDLQREFYEAGLERGQTKTESVRSVVHALLDNSHPERIQDKLRFS